MADGESGRHGWAFPVCGALPRSSLSMVARRGYAVGSAVLEAVLPHHDGPITAVPVETGDVGLEKLDGIEAKRAVVDQLSRALEIIKQHNPARIITLGGECSVSVAPFSELAARYGDDLAIFWIDSHPTSTPRRANIRAITPWPRRCADRPWRS